MKEGSSGGASLCEGFHEVDLWGGFFNRGTRKMRFLRDMQNVLQTSLPLHRNPVGKPGGGSFAVTFERRKSISRFLSWTRRSLRHVRPSEALASLGLTYLGSFFLDPEDNRKLIIGAIWKFGRNRAP
jgi:hypothetical protein